MDVNYAELSGVLVRPEAPLSRVLEILSQTPHRLVLVEDADRRVLGIVTDGDIRTAFLEGAALTTPSSEFMNTSFVSVTDDTSTVDASVILRTNGISHLPILDGEGHLLGMFKSDSFDSMDLLDNWVVIMAGGRGERLRPLTDTLPKPLVSIGDKTLLDSVIEKCELEGFQKYFISVNYLRDLIIEHVQQNHARFAEIDFLLEDRPLGTGGSLTLLPSEPTLPILVLNSDILHNVNLRKLLEFHESNESHVTVCARRYPVQIPFGVLESDGDAVTAITEKPTYTYLVNAGIYVVSPEALKLLDVDEYADMPDLVTRAINSKLKVSVFPVHEFWLDVGTHESLEQAKQLRGVWG